MYNARLSCDRLQVHNLTAADQTDRAAVSSQQSAAATTGSTFANAVPAHHPPQGPERTFIIYQVQAMGATYSGHFSPTQQTVLLVPVPRKPSDCSDKVAVALK
jgi:hypothetical protein